MLSSNFDLSGQHPLSSVQIESFRRDGHVLLREVVSPDELSFYRQAINTAAQRFNRETRPLEQRDTYGKAFLQTGSLWKRDETVRRFVLARRFARIAADLLGVRAVRLYNDQALFKEAGGGPTPWHQDQQYWPLDSPDTITMWMPLVPLSSQVGSMTFASGTHRDGELRPLDLDAPISDDSQRDFDALIAARNLKTVHYGAMNAGDATFHAGWTLHSAPPNPTEVMREVMTIIFFADGTRLKTPAQKFQQDDFDTFFPGARPGGLAANDSTPVLFERN